MNIKETMRSQIRNSSLELMRGQLDYLPLRMYYERIDLRCLLIIPKHLKQLLTFVYRYDC